MGFSIGGGFGALFGSSATRAQTRANNMLSELNAKLGNQTRQASNAAAAAEGNLARFVQSVNNNKALEAGGNAQEALVVNALRGSDANVRGNLSTDISNAEQAGHAAASAAASGIDGNVVDMVNASTELRNSIVKQSVDNNQSMQAYDTSRKAGNIMSQMVSSLDNSVILDRLNYNVDYAVNKPELSVFSQTLNGFFQGAQWFNNGASPNGDSQTQTAKTTTQYDGLATRQRSNSNYDLADYAYDNRDSKKYDFSFADQSSDKPSQYELWGSKSSFKMDDEGNYSSGNNGGSDQYSLFSR